jgi:hypothetical protein
MCRSALSGRPRRTTATGGAEDSPEVSRGRERGAEFVLDDRASAERRNPRNGLAENAPVSQIRTLLVAGLAQLLTAACLPRTDLAGQDRGGGAPTGATAAASLVEPAPGASDVPRNLAAVWVKFPEPVSVPDGALTLVATGAPAAMDSLAADGCPDGSEGVCLRLGLAASLEPGTPYVVTLGPGVTGIDGHDFPAGIVGQFVTALDADLKAPAIGGLGIQPAGPCARIEFVTDEPAQGTVRVEGQAEVRRISAGVGATQFSLVVSLAGFGAGESVVLVVEASDRAGNRSESAGVTLVVPADLVPLAITEIHANPAGPEPAQEFVEVRNLGSVPLGLGTLAIADGKGMDVLPEAMLDAGAYALVVPSGFDAASSRDTPPRGGVLLLRVDSRIGADGLSNTGEVVRLLSPLGHIISSYSAAVDVSAASWSGRSVHRIPEDACDQDASWTRHPAAATPGWAAP